MIDKAIKSLVMYALKQELIGHDDLDYVQNQLCDLLDFTSYKDVDTLVEATEEPSKILEPILDYAAEKGLIQPHTMMERDIFEAKLMNVFMSKPSHINKTFYDMYKLSPEIATDYYYHLSQKSNYIKTNRINKNIQWKSKTPYGIFDMTINLSKPEKDPKDIMTAGKHVSEDYPKCLLCKENVGFTGKPGRSNHRIVPLKLNQESFYLQYSPYAYYKEHCIVLSDHHQPMEMTEKTFVRLFDFVDMLPHYFLGSNAGLPIVGGSILSHEHYQGGRFSFPIKDAKVVTEHDVKGIKVQKLYWPLSVIRLSSRQKEKLIQASQLVFDTWKAYTNEKLQIYAFTDQPHNAITPIVRKENDTYIIDIALRNNLTSDEFPLGVFHPHPSHHHIKKENIGLIEVMGLAILPARLKASLEHIKTYLKKGDNLSKDDIHYHWYQKIRTLYQGKNIHAFIQEQVTLEFVHCLENAGVFKQDKEAQEAFDDFIHTIVKGLELV